MLSVLGKFSSERDAGLFSKKLLDLIQSRRRGKMSLRSTRSPCVQLFIIKLYSSGRAVLSHPDFLLSTCYYIRLD